MRQRPTIEVCYDSWCPICTAAREHMQRLDSLGLLRFQSVRDPDVPRRLGVPAEQLAERMYIRRSNGTVAEGIWAVAAVAARVPALMPLWPLLLLSGWLGLGQWAYDFVAQRRKIVPVGSCTDAACAAHPPYAEPRKDLPKLE